MVDVVIRVWKPGDSEPREVSTSMPAVPRKEDVITLDQDGEDLVEVTAIGWENQPPDGWVAFVDCRDL